MTSTSQKRIVRRPTIFTPAQWPSHVSPLLQRIYANRPLTSLNDLEKSLQALLPFRSLKNIDQACELLYKHLQAQSRIVVIGDFDADGATSTALAIKAMRMFGAKHIQYRVPNRFKFGYGLTPEIVDAVADLKPELLITVDNGISSIEGVAAAKAAGYDVLITDHHLPGATLPAADVIINPNQPGDEFIAKSSAGVGVIFYVMLALRSFLREKNWFVQNKLAEPNMASLLDLVALGTVADVVPLEHNNRILVEQGLKRIRAEQCSPGLLALLEVSQRIPARVAASDLGFAIGPRLNAAGRLEDMSLGIECLLTENKNTARKLAEQLHQLNADRRQIEADMQTQAFDVLRQLHIEERGELPFGLCLYDASWHVGVIGILASRIKDRYHRPVIIFADNGEGELKGSARSVACVHIRDILDNIAARHDGLLLKFGGHAMAAGLSISSDNLALFQSAFDEEIRRHLDKDELQGVVFTDGELAATELTLDTAKSLREAEPWGQHFPEPLFDGVFKIRQQRIVGTKHLKLSLQHPQLNRLIDAIAFNCIDASAKESPYSIDQSLRIAYRLDINEYQSNTNLQLLVEYMEVV